MMSVPAVYLADQTTKDALRMLLLPADASTWQNENVSYQFVLGLYPIDTKSEPAMIGAMVWSLSREALDTTGKVDLLLKNVKDLAVKYPTLLTMHQLSAYISPFAQIDKMMEITRKAINPHGFPLALDTADHAYLLLAYNAAVVGTFLFKPPTANYLDRSADNLNGLQQIAAHIRFRLAVENLLPAAR